MTPTQRRLYDCVIYNGEPILELRLRLLSARVDRFVIVESALTFKGDAKAPRFDAARYAPWADQIDYILLDAADFAGCHSAWERETLQRNAVLRGLADAAPHDWVLLSDVDEIPAPSALDALGDAPLALRQLSMAYYGNMLCRSEPYWLKGTRAVPVAALSQHTPEAIRLHFEACFPEGRWIDHGGWHFTYLGGVESIRQKIGEFSHQELNKKKLTSVTSIEGQIRRRLDIFYRPYAFTVVRAASVGGADMARWLADNGFLYPAGDDAVDVSDVLARDAACSPRQRRWAGRLLKWRQKWRRALATVASRWG